MKNFVSEEFDVVVCGGGPAGAVCAVSAARAGRRVALVERYGFLGGTATAGLVVPISGFFHRGSRVAGGIAWEVVERLEALDAARVEYPKGHVSVHPEYLKLVLERMARESGVRLFTNSWLSGCEKEKNKITAVGIVSKNGAEQIRGRCFVDATGDADLCFQAGAPMQPDSGQLQPLSLCFLLGGVDTATPLLQNSIHHDGKNGAPSCNAVIRDYLGQCAEAGRLEHFGGPWFNTLLKGDTLAVNVTRAAANGVDRESLTAAELQLREDMFTIIALLRQGFPEFRDCYLISSGVNAGVRETRRILGLETLTGEDLAKGKVPACPVAKCAHPMDVHSAGDSGQVLRPLDRPGYIPHTALIPRGSENLLACGRCVSADRDAFASLRVQATSMCTGEAAGIMASFCCEKNCPASCLEPGELNAAFRRRDFVK